MMSLLLLLLTTLKRAPQERRPDRIAKQMEDILVPPRMDEVVPVVPTDTSATAGVLG